MPLFKPCNCPSDIGEFAVYSGSSPGAGVASRMKYGFASQMVQFGTATGGVGTAIQAARGPTYSYLIGLGGGANFDVEEYNRGTDARTVVTNPWGIGAGGIQNNPTVAINSSAYSLVLRNLAFNAEFYTITWATNTYGFLGSFGGGATFAGGNSGMVCSTAGTGVVIAGNGSTESNVSWLFSPATLIFSVNPNTTVQAGQFFWCASTAPRGYFMGGQLAGVPLQTNVRYTFSTGAFSFTNNLPSFRSQTYCAYNATVAIGFPGGLTAPANAIANTECHRMTFATETTVFSTVLIPQATNSAGA